MSYFTTWLPDSVHRHYIVANCSLVSQYYLRCFPGQTIWVVLVAVALWDIYAVLSPYGPLNIVQSKAKDYSSSVSSLLSALTDTWDAELFYSNPKLGAKKSCDIVETCRTFQKITL